MGLRLNHRVWIRVWTAALCLSLYLSDATVMAQSPTVRLTTVRILEDSGLIRQLLSDFEKETGYCVEIYAGTQDVYERARNGKADVVISHYGFSEMESFVTEGLGLWPRLVFANQAALLGPPGDPAHIRGLADAVEGFRRIAQTKSPFLVNNNPTVKYIAQVLWESAGRPDKGDWYIDLGLEGPEAIEAADKMGAYTLWGLDPFLRFQEQHNIDIQALILNDVLFQRLMVAVVVNPEKVPGVNLEGAQALQRYLMAPATQVRIRAFRYPQLNQQVWWPHGLSSVSETSR